MKKFILRNAALAAALFAMVGCGEPTKEEILQKAENISTRSELESALGRPDDISKMGPIERWTYKASNGDVVFMLTGDSVALGATAGSAGE